MSYDLHSEDDDLQEIAPILSKIQKKSIQAPEGYFEQFPDSIMQIVTKEKPSMNWFSIAATVVILLASGVVFHMLDNKSESSIVETEILSDQYLHEIDEDVIIEYVSAIKDNNSNTDNTEITEDYLEEDYTEYELLEQYN
jgi:hypothetical protein